MCGCVHVCIALHGGCGGVLNLLIATLRLIKSLVLQCMM